MQKDVTFPGVGSPTRSKAGGSLSPRRSWQNLELELNASGLILRRKVFQNIEWGHLWSCSCHGGGRVQGVVVGEVWVEVILLVLKHRKYKVQSVL